MASGNTGDTRKQCDKATDPGYKAYTFALTGISPITDGNQYIRLRASMDVRALPSASAPHIKANA